MAAHDLLMFALAGLLLNLAPGPDVVYIVTRSLRSGARAGMVASLGIAAGCFVHIFAAALGVSALLAASTLAFTVLKWLGAAYLVYVGWRMLRSRTPLVFPGSQVQTVEHAPLRAMFLQGFWTNALNPKVALFFLAFVPQFIHPDITHKTLAFLGLGLLFNFNGLWVNFGWAWAAAWLARRVDTVGRTLHGIERAAGALFIGFGLKLALSDNPIS